MALKFDASPYLAAFQYGQDRTNQANQQYAQGMQGIGKGVGDLIQYKQQQQQEQQDKQRQALEGRYKTANTALEAEKAGLSGSTWLDYLQTGHLPQQGSDVSGMGQQTPQSPSFQMPSSGQMASAGTPDTGWSQEPSQMPSVPQPSPQQPQSSVIDAWNKSRQAPQQQGASPLFAKAPVDYGDPELNKLYAGRTPQQITQIEKAREFNQRQDESKSRQQETSDYRNQMMDMQRMNLTQTTGTKEEQQQDKLEQAYRVLRTKALSNRSGGLGLQDAKVNAAVHARQLIDGATDPKTGQININQITNPELAMSLASLVSGGNAPALETIREMTPQSLQGYVKSQIGYLFGKPVDVLPQEWAQNLKHMIDRQALTSEALRDNYMEQLKSQRPTRLATERASQLESQDLGTSYADTFGLPKIKLGKGANAALPQESSGLPKVGEVRKGYRFNGGDPSQQSSWVKVR